MKFCSILHSSATQPFTALCNIVLLFGCFTNSFHYITAHIVAKHCCTELFYRKSRTLSLSAICVWQCFTVFVHSISSLCLSTVFLHRVVADILIQSIVAQSWQDFDTLSFWCLATKQQLISAFAYQEIVGRRKGERRGIIGRRIIRRKRGKLPGDRQEGEKK